jgi:hypothetical protein
VRLLILRALGIVSVFGLVLVRLAAQGGSALKKRSCRTRSPLNRRDGRSSTGGLMRLSDPAARHAEAVRNSVQSPAIYVYPSAHPVYQSVPGGLIGHQLWR